MFNLVARPCGDVRVGVSPSGGTRKEMSDGQAEREGEEARTFKGRSHQESKEERERGESVEREVAEVYRHHPEVSSSSSSDDEESQNSLFSPRACKTVDSGASFSSSSSSSSSLPGGKTVVRRASGVEDERPQGLSHVEVSRSEKHLEASEGLQQRSEKTTFSSSSSSVQVVSSSPSSPVTDFSSPTTGTTSSRANSSVEARALPEQEEEEEGGRGTSFVSGLGRGDAPLDRSTCRATSPLTRHTSEEAQRNSSTSSSSVSPKASLLPLSSPPLLSSPSSLDTSQSRPPLYPLTNSVGGAGSSLPCLDQHSPSSLRRSSHALPSASSPHSCSSSVASVSSQPLAISSSTADKQSPAVFLPFFASSFSKETQQAASPIATARSSPISCPTTSTSLKSALSINPIGKFLQRFGETVSALKKNQSSPPPPPPPPLPSSLHLQNGESALPLSSSADPPEYRTGGTQPGSSRRFPEDLPRRPECGDEEEDRESRHRISFGRESGQRPCAFGEEGLVAKGNCQKGEGRGEYVKLQNRSELVLGEEGNMQKSMGEALERSSAQTRFYRVQEPGGDRKEDVWDTSGASGRGGGGGEGDKKPENGENSLVPRTYQHPFLSSSRLPYISGPYDSAAVSRHPFVHANTLAMATGGLGGGRGFPFLSSDEFLLAPSSSTSCPPPPPPFPVESHRAHMLMLMELQRLRGEMLHLQLATAAASKPLPPPNIIIQNKTEVASTTESNLQNLSQRDESPHKPNFFLDWISRFFSSRLNQLIALCSVGLGCYMLLEHWRHSWRMAQLRRRVDSNILLRGVQMLEETIGVRRPSPSPSFF